MSFCKIGSRTACGGAGCNARLVYGSPVWLQERDAELPQGTVLCVACATEGSPRDKALTDKAARNEGLTEREQRRVEYLRGQEPARLDRAKLWATLETGRRAAREQLTGPTESELSREKRLAGKAAEDLTADEQAFLARRAQGRAAIARRATVRQAQSPDGAPAIEPAPRVLAPAPSEQVQGVTPGEPMRRGGGRRG